jgi:translation initiation factor IF-3
LFAIERADTIRSLIQADPCSRKRAGPSSGSTSSEVTSIKKRGGKGGASDKRARTNDQIEATQVRLIDEDGEQIGITDLEEALEKAAEKELDLVEISPNAEPPVCRIMDYGKHLFEQKQKQKEARKKQRQTQLKEVKFRPGTDEGDYQIKLRNLKRFLDHGDKVKVTIRFRGREMAHQEIGRNLLARVEQDLEDIANVEQYPNMEGRQMIMVMAPGSKKKK